MQIKKNASKEDKEGRSSRRPRLTTTISYLREEGSRAVGLEDGLALRIGSARNAVSERELDVRLVELLDVFTFAVSRIDLLDSDDLNASVASTVSGGHF